jgi:hypothetical protein
MDLVALYHIGAVISMAVHIRIYKRTGRTQIECLLPLSVEISYCQKDIKRRITEN